MRKTIYQKTVKLSEYIKDIMYMNKYYLNNYSKFNTNHLRRITKCKLEFIRSYVFEYNYPETDSPIFCTIKYKDDFSNDKLLTLTSSMSHIKNNSTTKGFSYRFIQYPQLGNSVQVIPKYHSLLNMLVNAIETGSFVETEFQSLMIYNEDEISKIYLAILLHQDLLKIQFNSTPNIALCIGSTDVLRFINAKKALINLLDSKTGDWRNEIKESFGYIIK